MYEYINMLIKPDALHTWKISFCIESIQLQPSQISASMFYFSSLKIHKVLYKITGMNKEHMTAVLFDLLTSVKKKKRRTQMDVLAVPEITDSTLSLLSSFKAQKF